VNNKMAKLFCFAVLAVLSVVLKKTNGQCGTLAGYGCYRSVTTTTCTVSSSSVYYGWCALWGPQFAADKVTSYSHMAIYHSNYEGYPWYKIELSTGHTINSIVMRTRCDANQWWHFQNIEFRHNNADITAIAGIQITAGTLCNNVALSWWYQCGVVQATCMAPAAGQTHITIQQLVHDLMGGTNNGWGNQHSNVPFYFLMANEFEVYGA